MEFEILEANIEKLRKKLKTVQNKCHAYGCDFSYEEKGEVYKKVTIEETREKVIAKFIVIEVSGLAKVNDWEFIGTIEHLHPMNIVRCYKDDVEIPKEYYTAEPKCDHCHTKRNRKDTYLIRNTVTGEFRQVGRSCLQSFTNGLSAEAVARYVSFFEEPMLDGEAHVGAGYRSFYEPLELIRNAVEAVRMYGYVKKDCEFSEPTSSVVIDQIHEIGKYMKRINEGFTIQREGNLEKAEAILQWVASLPDDYGYKTNLKAACGREYCEGRDVGIICSAVAAYNRDQGFQQKRKEEHNHDLASEWVGEAGERVHLDSAKISVLTGWDGTYGYTYLYKIVHGTNVFTWKTAKVLLTDGEEEKTVSITGTVKNHNDFRGVKQTELTRCRVM